MLVPEQSTRRWPVFRLRADHGPDNLSELLGVPSPDLGRECEGHLPVHILQVGLHVPALERASGHGHDPSGDAEAPDIATGIVAIGAADDLGRHVTNGAHLGGHPLLPLAFFAVALEAARQPEVNELEGRRGAGALQQVVLGLHISVDQVARVKIAQRSQHLDGDAGRPRLDERPAFEEPVEQLAAAQQLDDQMRAVFRLVNGLESDDLRVVKGGVHSNLPRHVHQSFGRQPLQLDCLNGNFGAGALASSLMNCTAPTPAKHLFRQIEIVLDSAPRA
mmetsp:Transcript_9406/g.24216  ORF Transcript_9406/g.24216 Transcript_9406/m.24216 type:complete len:277 (+) Transcript_9406:110-940(+)